MDVVTWRARIGLFSYRGTKEARKRMFSKLINEGKGLKIQVSGKILLIVGILLIRAGIETNPGPGKRAANDVTEREVCKKRRVEDQGKLFTHTLR